MTISWLLVAAIYKQFAAGSPALTGDSFQALVEITETFKSVDSDGIEDGKLRPIQTLVGTRNKAAMIEVRNVGEYEFPFKAASSYAEGATATLPAEAPATTAGDRRERRPDLAEDAPALFRFLGSGKQAHQKPLRTLPLAPGPG